MLLRKVQGDRANPEIWTFQCNRYRTVKPSLFRPSHPKQSDLYLQPHLPWSTNILEVSSKNLAPPLFLHTLILGLYRPWHPHQKNELASQHGYLYAPRISRQMKSSLDL